jgi:hypothetical protein
VTELISLNRPCNQVVENLKAELRAGGMDVRLSFDLQNARRLLRDPDSCSCPHHGTARCTCQYMILLVSVPGVPPLTLVAHGHGRRTQIFLPDTLEPFDLRMIGIADQVRRTATALYVR